MKKNNKFYKLDSGTKIKIAIEYILFLVILILSQAIKHFPIFDLQSLFTWIIIQENNKKLTTLYLILVFLLLIVYPLYIAVSYNIDANDEGKKANPYSMVFILIPFIVGIIMLILHFF